MPPKRKAPDDDDEDYIDAGNFDDDDFDDEQSSKQGKRRGKGAKKGSGSSYTQDGEVIFQDFSKSLDLKKDHASRPIWVAKDNTIYLEAFSPHYQQACDFLVAISEPESRPEFIHTYRLTENSLMAAVAVSIDTEAIIKVLGKLCKTNLPSEVVAYIRKSTYTFGKAKIVLKNNSYHIESQFPEVLRQLLKNPKIRKARVQPGSSEATSSSSSSASASISSSSVVDDTAAVSVLATVDGFAVASAAVEDVRNLDYTRIAIQEMDGDGEGDDEIADRQAEKLGGQGAHSGKAVSFMIAQHKVQEVKRSSKEESHYPLMEEYDFKNDSRNPVLNFDLRPSTRIRPYQEKSLSKMFGNGRARSGIIVLPCGAGKSLTGVTAASTVKRSCVVMCINNASVKQWKEQFTMWTNIEEKSIFMFTSGVKEYLPPAHKPCIVISTYSMICHGGRRSAGGERMIRDIASREWGLMILDEVHVAPAEMFQKVVNLVNAHCKLGLTATLVREDKKIENLIFLVGPKLYEANWIDLTNQGFLARVQCVEVWCPMTKEFFAEYIRKGVVGAHSRLQRLLYVLNPTKFRSCEHLVNYHANRGDKIIIFSDDVAALILYCEALKPVQAIPYIYGGTPDERRRSILTAFKTRSDFNCIGLSKVGDTALDIPEANVVIQISSHFGGRRQEAQRLGRILRPKPNPTGGFNAHFYTLVSTDTREMYFSTKRQQYLVDQGYTFRVDQELAETANRESRLLRTVSDELDLLRKVVDYDYVADDAMEDKVLRSLAEGEYEEDEGRGGGSSSGGGGGDTMDGAVRRVSTLSALSGAGAGGQLYSEF